MNTSVFPTNTADFQVPVIFCLTNSSEITFIEKTCVEQQRQCNFIYMEEWGKKVTVKKM